MLARQALTDGPATLAGCAAIFSGYSMFTAYERSAFGELAGGFWIPLLLLLVFRDRNPQGSVWRRAFDGSAALLALVIAGAWLSNAPLGVMASYLLAAVALTVAVLRALVGSVLRSAIAVTLGLGLSAIYLVPAAVEQRWVQIRQATDDPGLAIENSLLFGRHADPNLELHDVELWRVSAIAVTHDRPRASVRLHRVAARTAPPAPLVDSARPHPRWPSCFCNFPSHFPLEHPAQAALSAVPLAMAGRARSADRHLLRRCHLAHTALAARRRDQLCLPRSFFPSLAVTTVRLPPGLRRAKIRSTACSPLIAAARDSRAPTSTRRPVRTTR